MFLPYVARLSIIRLKVD